MYGYEVKVSFLRSCFIIICWILILFFRYWIYDKMFVVIFFGFVGNKLFLFSCIKYLVDWVWKFKNFNRVLIEEKKGFFKFWILF